MSSDTLVTLASHGYARAYGYRYDIAGLALRAMLSAPGGTKGTGALSGLSMKAGPGLRAPGVRDYAAALAARTVCLTLLAGSGSRWVRSLREARDRGVPELAGIEPDAPRGLFPVRDFLSANSAGKQNRMIAVAAYSVDAVDALGRHLVVVRGYEDRIRAEIMDRLGIPPDRCAFFTQEAFSGKPLGHGDAAWQCREVWKDADYVITNFGGDANSPLTCLSSLLALDALDACGEAVDFILPAAPVDNPAYPIHFGPDGLPLSFGHAKLQGKTTGPGAGYTNVGIRVYRAAALYEKLESIHDLHWREGVGYDIPGNDPAGHEFALDNVDAEFAAEGRARVLAIARADELTPAKSLDDVPAFEAAMSRVRAEWDREGPGILG